MADDPRVPREVLDAVMADPTTHRLLWLISGKQEPTPGEVRNLRTDLSGLLATGLDAWMRPTA